MAKMVKSLPPMQETQVQSLGGEDPLEKEMAAHSSNSCLENSMDREAWQAIVQGIAKSQTRLPLALVSFIYNSTQHIMLKNAISSY